MSVVQDREYWVGNGMADGQQQAAFDYATSRGQDYSRRSYSWQIGYTAWMERQQLEHGRRTIADLVPAQLNHRGLTAEQ